MIDFLPTILRLMPLRRMGLAWTAGRTQEHPKPTVQDYEHCRPDLWFKQIMHILSFDLG